MTQVIPTLTALSEDQKNFIHTRSLDILSRVGVRVDSPRGRQLLSASGAAAADPGDPARIRLEPGLVEWALSNAPASIDIYNRRGDLAFQLGSTANTRSTAPAGQTFPGTRFGIGVTNLYYQDPQNENIATFTRQHMALATRLGQALPQYDVISTVGVIQDYPPETADLYAVLEMVANTEKPLVLLVSNEALFDSALDLLETIDPALRQHPFIIPYFNPITPLVINAATVDKMLATIARGLPLIYSNYSMAGMSTPITAAGTLTLMNAELLAGLVLAQLARPGTPVILGSLPAYFDMKTMQDFYDPHTVLMNAACAEMMAHYNIPHAGTSGSGSGWGADLAGGGLVWLNHLVSLLGRAGLAPFVGGNFGSKVFSPALAVYSNEVIAQARRFAQGFALDDAALGLNEIEKAGPAGSFLDSDTTLRLFRQAYYDSRIFPRWSLERWQQSGQPRLEDLLRQYTVKLLAESPAPGDHDEILATGEAFIRD
jgi:trimethylamine---corrinoid protein Co-methyltransferase